MPDIDWNEGLPSDVESAGLGDDRIRSLKTSLRVGLDSEHLWASSGIGAGVHRLGSARAYYGPQSLVSSSGTDGRLMVTSDTSILCHVGSAGTMFLGGSAVISAISQPVGGSRFYWAMEFGQDTMAIGTTSKIVTFANSGFSGVPFTVLTPSALTVAMAVGGSGSKTGFTALSSIALSNAYTFQWHSIGSRTL